MRTDILERRAEIQQWITENQSKAFICRQLQCKQTTLNRWLEKIGIDYEGNQSGKGFTKNCPSTYENLLDYLANSPDVQTNKVRKHLLKEGYKEHKCERCGLTEWLGQPIPLEVHHKDGNRENNCLDNYELICPNCHALTDSYRGKNIGK